MAKERSKLLRILRKQWLLVILSIVVILIYMFTHFKYGHIRKLKGAKSELNSAQMNEVVSPIQMNTAELSDQIVVDLSAQDGTS